jgi:hypothetical protein
MDGSEEQDFHGAGCPPVCCHIDPAAELFPTMTVQKRLFPEFDPQPLTTPAAHVTFGHAHTRFECVSR